MSHIFISYRRQDNSHAAGRLYSELASLVGRDRIFMDVDAIPPGVDFVDVLEQKVATCDVLLAIIGPGWLDAKDEFGRRRLDRPGDFVRIEIAAALNRKIPVVRVPMDGAQMPDAENLPEDLKSLARRQATVLSHRGFRTDVEQLVQQLALRLSERKDVTPLRPKATQARPVLTNCPRHGHETTTILPSEQDVIAALDDLASELSLFMILDRDVDLIQVHAGEDDQHQIIYPITFLVNLQIHLSPKHCESYWLCPKHQDSYWLFDVGPEEFDNIDRVKQIFLAWIRSRQLPPDLALIPDPDFGSRQIDHSKSLPLMKRLTQRLGLRAGR